MAAGTACYRIPLALVSLCLLWVRERFFIHKQGLSGYHTVV